MTPAAAAESPELKELGKKLRTCDLGNDCPFEPAMRRLEEEEHTRIQQDSAFRVQLDEVVTILSTLTNTIQELARRVGDVEHHIRKSRLVDLAIMSLAAGLGGFLAKLITQ